MLRLEHMGRESIEHRFARVKAEQEGALKGIEALTQKQEHVDGWIAELQHQNQELTQNSNEMNANPELAQDIAEKRAKAIESIKLLEEEAHELFRDLEKIEMVEEQAVQMHGLIDHIDNAIAALSEGWDQVDPQVRLAA